MKLIRFLHQGQVHAGVITTNGIAPVTEINAKFGSKVPNDLLAIIQSGDLAPLRDAAQAMALPPTEVTPLLPYPVPPKIWCIGLNYKSHA